MSGEPLESFIETKAVYGNILRYARGFAQRELGVMLVTDMQRCVGRPLIDVPEFGEWADSVGELVLFDRNPT